MSWEPIEPVGDEVAIEDVSWGSFFGNVIGYAAANPNQRMGQALFNLLYQCRPDLSEQLRATPLDPFYSTDVVPTLTWLVQHWGDAPPEDVA